MNLIYAILVIVGVSTLGFFLSSYMERRQKRLLQEFQDLNGNPALKSATTLMGTYQQIQFNNFKWWFLIGGVLLVFIILLALFNKLSI